jgi:hypothetical protein
MTRDQIRQSIDLLENLHDVMQAQDDVSDVEFEEHEAKVLHLRVCYGDEEQPVTFMHRLPPEVVLVGLSAMRAELERMAAATKVEA